MMTEYKCKICDNSKNNKELIGREMMFGFHDEFIYFKCSLCGCLQINQPPADLAKYYPIDQYYSFQSQPKKNWKTTVKNILFQLYYRRILPYNFFYQKESNLLSVLRDMDFQSPILDVGCGNGNFLQQMATWGYRNLTGIDPFIDKDITLDKNSGKVLKQTVFEHTGSYSLIMMSGVLEHMDHQTDVMQELHRLLKPDGILLIQIPVVDSFAWRKYDVNWFQLDAPRHFYIHSVKSMNYLAKNTGFVIKDEHYESGAYQFIESEKYIRNIKYSGSFPFSSEFEKECHKQAKILNKMKDGDVVRFVLQKQ
ncbi:class I SAM-dependent methyltransferase [Chryseobacterium formosus]|uniref:Class I SAM-dependent methyltransferase n=1 Tax=Chryseobacterium formosus TaxID=1537363 RepID=A0ABT3XRL1_9FLAO|nr:class I SAM-dependent methyltransferase [Chryseobacterium formosus]MCX8523560.1 class I SAM-dependent methyltransferase [Chryseobacterium formosus]